MTKKIQIASRYLLLFLFALIFTNSHAQSEWNWPSDPAIDKMAKEKQAFYKVLMAQEKYEEAFHEQYWLFKNNPDLHPSIYKDAAKILEHILEEGLEAERLAILEDSLLWAYDMRIKYFPEDKANATDRKAYTAFKLYYKTASKYGDLLDYYEDLYALPLVEISKFNITPYMTLATYYYKADPKEMPAEKVLDIHEQITNVIEGKINAGENLTAYLKEQDKIDAFLSSLSEILNCEFISERLVPRLESDPNDLNTAKKIFSYSLKAKCTDQPYFVQAGAVLFQNKPTFSLAKALADKKYSSSEYKEAYEYYEKALKYAETDTERYQGHYGQALSQSKLGNKPLARSYARQALSEKPDAKDAYNLIGNLYYSSYEECKKGESKVLDRAVFIAAYNMYAKSGNTSQMEASQSQFPSIQEIFSEGKEENQAIVLTCWINETVVLKRR